MAETMNYKTADQLPLMEEVTETTHAIVEDGGTLKRVSGSMLGGGGGGKVCYIDITEEGDEASTASTLSLENLMSGVSTAASAASPTYVGSCANMTFDEVYATLEAGEYLPIVFRIAVEGNMMFPAGLIRFVDSNAAASDADTDGREIILACSTILSIQCIWMAAGMQITIGG